MTKQFIEEQIKNWNIHQVGCDWNRTRIYGSKVCDMNCNNVFDGLLSSILATEEEFRKRVEGMKKYEPHIGIGHLHEADMQIAYNQALTDLLSTLTPKE